MKKIIFLLCVITVLCGTFASSACAMDIPTVEIISAEDFVADIKRATGVDYLTDKTRGTKKPSISDTWDIYLQDYAFNMKGR